MLIVAKIAGVVGLISMGYLMYQYMIELVSDMRHESAKQYLKEYFDDKEMEAITNRIRRIENHERRRERINRIERNKKKRELTRLTKEFMTKKYEA